MSYETDIFMSVYNTMTWARCRIKVGREIIETATTAGIDIERENTDQGQYHILSGDIRCKAVDEPEQGMDIGDKIEISLAGKDWIKARISGRGGQGGVSRIILESPHV